MKRRSRTALVSQHEHLSGPISEHVLRAPSLSKLIDGYLIALRSEGKSPNTVSYNQWLLGKFLWWCEHGNAPLSVDHITTGHVRQFLVCVQREPVRWGGRSASSRRPATQTTLQHYYRSLHVFFRWLASEGLIASNPLDTIKKTKAEQNVVQALSQEEVKRLLSLCNGNTFLDVRNKAILMLFLDTGLRLSELAGLGISDIDFERGTVLVRKGEEQKAAHTPPWESVSTGAVEVADAQGFDAALRRLSLNQQRFLALRSLCPNDTRTAEIVGVSHSTINNWKHDPRFMRRYSSMHVQLSSALKRLLVANGVLPADRTTGLLADPETDGDVLVRIIQIAFGALGLGKKAAPVLQQQINVQSGPRDFPIEVVNAESAKRGLPPLKE